MATLNAIDVSFGEMPEIRNPFTKLENETNGVDLFCGAGGTSEGLEMAAKRMGKKLNLLAINHWATAIETHTANHPLAIHKCESLDNVNPRKAVPSGKLDILVASPECTHHSNARGGAPISDQSRASAWMVLRWCEALDIQNVLIENVPEFQTWGPVYEDCTCGAGIDAKKHLKGCHFHRPIPKMKGRIYRVFLSSLRALGYQVSARVLVAADYGDPTTRKRLFIMARKGKKVVWPEPTHSKHGDNLFGKHPKWRAAREIIDWSVPGQSIYERSKPLVPKTLRRIAHGLEKFGGGAFVLGQQSGAAPRHVDDPLPTVASAGAISLIQPFIVQGDMGGSLHDIDEPMPTITSADAWGLVEPFIMPVHHGGDLRTYSIENPMPTITGFDGLGLVEPFVVEYYGTGDAESVDDPLNTVTGRDRFGLVQPFITEYHGGKYGDERVRSIDEPLPTQDTSNRFGLVEPMILRGADGKYYLLDIRYRMLMPSELAAAMSFPPDYVFFGNRENVVKQIGNAVPVSLASHLCQALLS